MEENAAEGDVVGMPGVNLGRDILMYSRGRGSGKPLETIQNIDGCSKDRVESCTCASKTHYQVEERLLCIKDMKPFVYIAKAHASHPSKKDRRGS